MSSITHSFTSALTSSYLPLTTLTLAVSLLAFLVAHLGRSTVDTSLKLPSRPVYFYLGAPGFFKDPYEYLYEGIRWAKDSMFSFKVMNNTVIVLRGFLGRDVILTKGMDFLGGYRLLSPHVESVMPSKPVSGDDTWSSYIAKTFRHEALLDILPLMVQNVTSKLDKWGKSGSVNPFESVYEISFSTVLRPASCPEIYNSPENTKKLQDIFTVLEGASEPDSMIMPFIPTPARISRVIAFAKYYFLISGIANARKKEDRHEKDLLQSLIDQDWSNLDTTKFMAMALFSSSTNLLTVTNWLSVFINLRPEWRTKVRAEIDAWAAEHNPDFDTVQSDALLNSLDTGLPLLEQCINETIRVAVLGTITRMNLIDDLQVSGQPISKGTFLMWPIAELHSHPTLYPTPEEWNPDNFSEEALKQRSQYGLTFFGWGAGYHPCVGKQFAIKFMKLIIVMIMQRFDIDVVGKDGEPLERMPKMRHHLLQTSFPEEVVRLRYKARQ